MRKAKRKRPAFAGRFLLGSKCWLDAGRLSGSLVSQAIRLMASGLEVGGVFTGEYGLDEDRSALEPLAAYPIFTGEYSETAVRSRELRPRSVCGVGRCDSVFTGEYGVKGDWPTLELPVMHPIFTGEYSQTQCPCPAGKSRSRRWIASGVCHAPRRHSVFTGEYGVKGEGPAKELPFTHEIFTGEYCFTELARKPDNDPHAIFTGE